MDAQRSALPDVSQAEPTLLTTRRPNRGCPGRTHAQQRSPQVEFAQTAARIQAPKPRARSEFSGLHSLLVAERTVPQGQRITFIYLCILGLFVYPWCMSRTNIDIDDKACAEVMRRFRFSTKRAAINFALRTLAAESASIDEARALRGSGWEGDLESMRSDRRP